jgi:putative ABC transport system permease protein
LTLKSLSGDVRFVVGDVLKTVGVARITTLTDQIDATIVPERLVATLSGFFAGLGVLLAGIGLYGLLAYTVARRINEIGIRLALGATAGDVTFMVLGETLAMVAGGLIIAVPLAIWGRKLAVMLIQDPAMQTGGPIIVGAAVIIGGSLVASFLPARRAARVNPMQALRHE